MPGGQWGLDTGCRGRSGCWGTVWALDEDELGVAKDAAGEGAWVASRLGEVVEVACP